MSSIPVSTEILKKFMEVAIEKLEGDWIVIGGTVLPLLGFADRVTYDIDMVGPLESSMEQTLKLMEIANSLGLPVETINQAGAYFFYKINPPKKSLVLMSESKHCRIYRPGTKLFVQLKIQRLSESDLQDCLQMLAKFKKEMNSHDKKELLEAIQTEADKSSSKPRTDRLFSLKTALS